MAASTRSLSPAEGTGNAASRSDADPSTSTSRPGTRRRRDETRRLLVDTGVRLLLAQGLQGGCDHVGMADVLAAVHRETGQRITNASVYGRIWENQAEFHRELLQAAASYYPNGEEQATLERARAILASRDLATPEARAVALRELCRDAGDAHLAALSASRAWQTWLAIWAITVSTPTLDDDVARGPAIAERHDRAVRDFADVLAEVLPTLRFRPRDGLTTLHVATAVYALSEGIALHDRFSAVDTSVAMTVDGSPERWSLFSASVDALLAGFLVPC